MDRLRRRAATPLRTTRLRDWSEIGCGPLDGTCGYGIWARTEIYTEYSIIRCNVTTALSECTDAVDGGACARVTTRCTTWETDASGQIRTSRSLFAQVCTLASRLCTPLSRAWLQPRAACSGSSRARGRPPPLPPARRRPASHRRLTPRSAGVQYSLALVDRGFSAQLVHVCAARLG